MWRARSAGSDGTSPGGGTSVQSDVRTQLLLAILLLAAAAPGSAQPAAPPPPPAPGAPAPPTYRLTGSRFAVAQDVVVTADEEVTDGVAVVGGSARIDGRVGEGILVVGGDLHLGSTADVRGDVVLVGGTLVRDQGARLSGGVSYVSFGDWSRRTGLFGWWPRLEFGNTGRWLSLAATLFRLSILAVLMLLVLLVARGPVARVGRAAAAEPVRAAIVGLAAEVLFLPVVLVFSLALGLTIIGLPFVFLLVPVAILVALVALLLGFTALACRLGEWLEDRLGWRPRSALLATAMGMVLIITPTLLARLLGMAPEPLRLAAFGVLIAGAVAEFLVWTIGLGATLLTGFGRWNTTPPPIEVRA
jgi:hypothetical protein